MKFRRSQQMAIARYYQRLENEDKRRKTAEGIKKQKGFLKKLFGRG